MKDDRMTIPLQETHFELADIDDRVIGAGILPVSVDLAGVIRVLLGKERYINHWRGSLKWSGFEGGRKAGEAIEATAAREFFEESIASVQLGDEERPTMKGVIDYLVNKKYIARIVLCIVHGEQAERRYHVTYVVQVPYQHDCAFAFSLRRRNIVDLQARYHVYSKLSDLILTSTTLPHEERKGEDVSGVTRVEHADGLLRVEYVDSHGDRHVHEYSELSFDLCASYLRWFDARVALTNECAALEGECAHLLTVHRNAADAAVSVKINDDFIEKQSVQWWTTQDLRKVLQNGGYINNEFFRAYFLPVLQRALCEVCPTSRAASTDPCHHPAARAALKKKIHLGTQGWPREAAAGPFCSSSPR